MKCRQNVQIVSILILQHVSPVSFRKRLETTFLPDLFGKKPDPLFSNALKEVPVSEDEIVKACNIENILSSGITFPDSSLELNLFARIASAEEYIREFQTERGSAIARDYMLAFVKVVSFKVVPRSH